MSKAPPKDFTAFVAATPAVGAILRTLRELHGVDTKFGRSIDRVEAAATLSIALIQVMTPMPKAERDAVLKAIGDRMDELHVDLAVQRAVATGAKQ